MKKAVIIVAGAGLAFLGYLAGSPYLTAYQLKQAVDEGDGAKVASYIDYPLVRGNLKQDITTLVSREHQLKGSDNSLSGLNANIAISVLNGMVDMLVTPENTVSIIEGADTDDVMMNPDIFRPGEQTDIQESDLNYRGINTFEIAVTNSDEETVTLSMDRRLLTWKVTKVSIPDKYFQ